MWNTSLGQLLWTPGLGIVIQLNMSIPSIVEQEAMETENM